jgi:hypothetical protein
MSKCVGVIFISIAVFATGSAARGQCVERVTKVDTGISSGLAVDATYPCKTNPRMQAAVRGVVALTGPNQRVEVGRSLYAQVGDAAASFQIVLRQQWKASAPDFAREFTPANGSAARP